MSMITPPASMEETSSIQEHAAHPMEVSDAVHQSNHQMQEKLDVLFDSDASFVNDESMEASDGSEMQVTADEAAPELNGSPSTVEVELPLPEQKKLKFDTESELKPQIIDCNEAVVTIQENADLKYLKLESQLSDLKASLGTARNDLDQAKAQIQRLEKENLMMEENLQNTVGKDHAELLKVIKLKNDDLEALLQKVKLERDNALADNEAMTKAMTDCAQCAKKLLNRAPAAEQAKSATKMSFWESFNVAIVGLTAEAELTPASPVTLRRASAVMKQPPQDMFVLHDQPTQVQKSLQVDIEAIEKQVLGELKALESEWSKPSSKSSSRGHRKRHSDKTKDREKAKNKPVNAIGGISSLDSFFASASHGLSLQSEEMDEECSLFSMTRSVATAPVGDTSTKRKKKSSRHEVQKSSSSGMRDRRRSYMLSGGTPFRESFRASLLGLGEEVSGASKTNMPDWTPLDADSNCHVDHPQREVEQWRGTSKATVLAL